MTELVSLKKSRGAHRHDVKMKIQSSEQIISEYSDEREPELQSVREILTRKLGLLRGLDEEIQSLLLDAEQDLLNEEVVSSSNVSDEINKCLWRIDKCLKSFAKADVEQNSERPSSRSSMVGTTSSGLGIGKVRLPKLELPKFNGDPRMYQSWRDSFDSVIHNNDSLSEIDRFNYLKSLVVGPALSCISGLPVTKDNYLAALDLIADRFGRRHVVISSHMDSLMKISLVSDVNDLKRLRRVYDQVESHLRSLKALGIGSESYGCLLVPVILSRLPEEMKLIISRKLDPKGEIWELDQLLEVFKGEIEARERAGFVSAGPTKRSDLEHEKPTAAVLYTPADEKVCVFCKGKHKPVSCKVVTELNARRAHLRKSGKCFVCLRSGHVAKSCRFANCKECGRKHHVALCDQVVRGSGQCNELALSDKSVPASTMLVNSATNVLLQTAKACVSKPGYGGSDEVVRIILDTGSQRSYITQRLSKKLRLPVIGTEYLNISTFGDGSASVQKCNVAQMSVKGLTSDEEVIVTVCTVPKIGPPPGGQEIKFAVEKYPHLLGLNLADEPGDGCCNVDEVEILIGSDFYWAFVLDEIVRGQGGPVALSSRLGWILSGPVHMINVETSDQTHTLLTLSNVVEPLQAAVDRLWDLETIGICPDKDSNVMLRFTESVRFNGTRYEVTLPWRSGQEILADNYALAHKRLMSLLARLKKEPSLLAEYDQVMKDQLSQGILEVVPDDSPPVGGAYYMPHHPVVRRDKTTTKLRVVYDASSRIVGPSLNQALYEGPCLLPELFGVLCRFRFFKVGVVGDLEKAFHQVELSEGDRDFHRLLWVHNLHLPDPVVTVLRFTRCVFGVTSSPFHLLATIQFHLDQYKECYPHVVKELSKCMYVDDLTSGADNVADAFQLVSIAKELFNAGGFNLRKFESNSIELTEALSSETVADCNQHCEDLSYSELMTGSPEVSVCASEHKVLGLVWDKESDSFVFRFQTMMELAESLKLTKRGLLQFLAKNFDPLGLVSPIIVRWKVAFQEACKLNIKWDDPLTPELVKKFQGWLKDLKNVLCIKMSRFCLVDCRGTITSAQLIGFCDASKDAYGAAVYVRSARGSHVRVELLCSKSRVSPLKNGQTIPRLELLGCLVLARLMATVRSIVESVCTIDNEICFSDSKTALCWIANRNQQYKQFIENRVVEIRSKVPVDCWKHVAGEQNPADILSRGSSASELQHNELWFKGPTWLTFPLSEWPMSDVGSELTVEGAEEMKASDKKLFCTDSVFIVYSSNVHDVIQCEDYSSLQRLLQVTAWVRRFVSNLRCRALKLPDLVKIGALCTEEVEDAERLWILSAQSRMNVDYVDKLSEQLTLFKDEHGMLRCKGRLENADLDYHQRFPILLTRYHHITKLIVLDAHNRVMHGGTNATMVMIRDRFWIPCLRQLVKQLLHRCVVCRRFQGKSFAGKPFPPLPNFRVVFNEPFLSTGIDFAGPLYVRCTHDRSVVSKAYILLMTCASSRAVHLELVPDMSTAGLLRGLRRFIARRGAPRLILSDNAKTFKSEEARQFARDRGITWRFNTPEAPWTGGVFERMVGLVKRCLRKVLGCAHLSYEELETVLIETESVVNDRPISYVDTDTTEEPLTPNHLIYGRRLLGRQLESQISDSVQISCFSGNQARKRVMYRQRLVSNFQKRWKREYLLFLRQSCGLGRKKGGRDIEIGDVVLVEDHNPRVMWRMGRVVELIASRDGVVRAAQVQLGDKRTGTGKSGTLKRPLQRLYPLEVQCKSHSLGPNLSAIGRGDLPSNPSGGQQLSSLQVSDCQENGKSAELQTQDCPEMNRLADASRSAERSRRSKRAAAFDCDFKRTLLNQV